MPGIFETFTILLALTALASYVNHTRLKLHPAIGIMIVSLIMGIGMTILASLGMTSMQHLMLTVDRIDFGHLVLKCLLGLILFSGAMQVNLSELLDVKWLVISFAIASVAISAIVIAGLLWLILNYMGIELGFIYCLLFGALISPTDTVAVLAIVRRLGAPRDIAALITGEALFNDGAGVVLFLAILGVMSGESISPIQLAGLFLFEALGGVAVGYLIARLGLRMMEQVNDYKLHTLMTLAMATCVFTLANFLHMSGVIAAVIAGLTVGAAKARLPIKAFENVGVFWEVVDDILNAVLFALLGLEVMLIDRTVRLEWPHFLVSGLAAIVVVLAGRLVSIAIPVQIARFKRSIPRYSVRILTWGALRGGLPVAMSVALPYATAAQSDARDLIMAMTYAVVAFSLIVQGLTLPRLISKTIPAQQNHHRGPADQNV